MTLLKRLWRRLLAGVVNSVDLLLLVDSKPPEPRIADVLLALCTESRSVRLRSWAAEGVLTSAMDWERITEGVVFLFGVDSVASRATDHVTLVHVN